MLDSVLHAYQKHQPKTFLEECKYEKEKIKTKNHTDEELKSGSDNDNGTDNDNDTDNDE